MAKAGMRGRRIPGDHYSGHMHERDVLGKFRQTAAFKKAWRALGDQKGYMNYNAAMSLVKAHYKGDPTNPEKPFANELRLAVADILGLESDEDMDKLRYYPAEGTPFDLWHGVDSWMEFDLGEGRVAVVKFDATLNTKDKTHASETKADVLIKEIPDADREEDRFMRVVEKAYAPKVAAILQDRIRALKLRGGGPRKAA